MHKTPTATVLARLMAEDPNIDGNATHLHRLHKKLHFRVVDNAFLHYCFFQHLPDAPPAACPWVARVGRFNHRWPGGTCRAQMVSVASTRRRAAREPKQHRKPPAFRSDQAMLHRATKQSGDPHGQPYRLQVDLYHLDAGHCGHRLATRRNRAGGRMKTYSSEAERQRQQAIRNALRIRAYRERQAQHRRNHADAKTA